MQDEHQLHNTVNKPITCTVYMYIHVHVYKWDEYQQHS